MDADAIGAALEAHVGVPEAAIRDAICGFSPAVIAVAPAEAAGRFPLPREQRLLRVGFAALSGARESGVCTAFLAFLCGPPLEMEWRFAEEARVNRAACRLRGRSAGDGPSGHAVAADSQSPVTCVPDCGTLWHAMSGSSLDASKLVV